MKFIYAKNVESDEPIMLINTHVGFDPEDGMGIDGSLFQEELLALDAMGKKRIQVWINSVGGVVLDGYNICNAILKSKTRVDTYNMGMAASIAGVIFQTGRKRIMADYSFLMYHNPYQGETKTSPMLDSMKASLNKIVSARSGMNDDEVSKMMDRESFIQADEAFTLGLCDEIESTVNINTKNFPKEVRAFAKEAGAVLNKIFNKPNMTKVTNKLQLNADANEESILEAMATAQNKAVDSALAVVNKKSKDEMDKMACDLKAAEDSLASMKEAYDKATAELTEATDKAAEVEDSIKTATAKAIVVEYVKAGKIKNDAKVIDEATAKMKADEVGMKSIFDAIPTNKIAEKFVIATEQKVKGASVATAMAKLEAKYK
jgi:ATP-dependent Clp protease protease subunit